MVVVRNQFLPVQVLYKATPTVLVHRQEAEVAVEDDGDPVPVQTQRFSAQILVKIPAITVVHRQEAEAAIEDSGAAVTVRTQRLSTQVLTKIPPLVAVLRQEGEAAVEDDRGAAPVRVRRLSAQLIVKTPPPGPTPIPLPPELSIYLHNWVAPFQMTSSFKTDISAAKTTSVQTRRAYRVKPARTFSIRVLDHQEDISLALTQLRRSTKEQMPVPLSCDFIPVTASSSGQPVLNCVPEFRRFFAGARIAVVQSCKARIIAPADRDIYIIQTVFADNLLLTTNLLRTYNATWDVVPMVDCEINLSLGTGWVTDQMAEVSIPFTEIVGPSQLNQTSATTPAPAGWPQHTDGLPIFEVMAREVLDWKADIGVAFERPGEVGPRGRKIHVSPNGPRESQVQEHHFTLQRAPFWDVLRFFDSRMGSLLTFWEVDLEHRWITVSALGTFLEVQPDSGDFDKSFKDLVLDSGYIGIVMNGGLVVHIRKIATILFTGGKWRCTLDAAEPPLAGIDLTDIQRTAVARQVQFSSDTITETWTTTNIVDLTLSTTEALDEKDIDL